MVVAADGAAGRHLQMVYLQYPIPVFTHFFFAPKGIVIFCSIPVPLTGDLPAMLAEEVAGGLPGARLAAVTRGSSGAIYGVLWSELI